MTGFCISDLEWLIGRLRREQGKDHATRPRSHRAGVGRHTAGAR